MIKLLMNFEMSFGKLHLIMMCMLPFLHIQIIKL